MKKFCSVLIASAVVASAVPALAFENKFGGYWRTRAFTQKDFNPNEAGDSSRADSRTRLFYTAEFNKNFKFVNKFEMDAIWGSKEYYDRPAATNKPGSGGIGADSISVEVKNTYADFTFDLVNNSTLNFKLGTQGTALSRGFLFNDDFSGGIVTYGMKNVKLPFLWLKYYEGGPGVDNLGDKMNDQDLDVYAVSPEISLGNGAMINPLLAYETRESTETDLYTLGLNAELKNDKLTAWLVAMYQGGEISEADLSAYLIAAGADFNVNKQLTLCAKGFYASGDDDANDGDIESYYGFNKLQGQDFHWAEIMGGGIFDNNVSNGIGGYGYNAISNISAVNIGASFKAMDKLTLYGDVWYAMLNEVAEGADDDLGVEVDLRAKYMLFENLSLDLVGAYLFAGDATGDDDPYEVGTQLELKF